MFGVSVGHASLVTEPVRAGSPDAVAVVRHELRADSNAMVDLLFPVHDRIASLARADASGSLRYSAQVSEGDSVLNYDLLFASQQVQRFGPGGKHEIMVPPYCQDPLSLYYALRTVGPGAGPGTRRPVSDGLLFTHSRMRVRGLEEIEVPAGRFKALHVVLETPGVRGVFRLAEGEAVHLWITGDESLVPLRLAARVRVGPFTGNLRADLTARETGHDAGVARGGGDGGEYSTAGSGGGQPAGDAKGGGGRWGT